MSFRINKYWPEKYLRLSTAGLSTAVRVPESTGEYAVYGLKRDVATLLVDNLSASDLSAYVYNTDGMGISVLPEGFSAISGNNSLRQFAIKNDGRLYVRTTGGSDPWSLLDWIPEDKTMLAGGAFVSSASVSPISISVVSYISNGGYYTTRDVNLSAHAVDGVTPKVKCLSGGGSDDYHPMSIVEYGAGNRRLVILKRNGYNKTYAYCDVITDNVSIGYAPHTPTKTDYLACTGPGGLEPIDWGSDGNDDPYSGGELSGVGRAFGAAISASGGVDVIGRNINSEALFYALDTSTVFKYVSGCYIADNGSRSTMRGSIYVATNDAVKYIKPGNGYINLTTPNQATDMYTVPVTGLPTNYTVVKLVGGTGTTDPSVPEGDTDNIVIIRKG